MKQSKAAKPVIMLLDQSFGTLRLAREKSPVSLTGIDLGPGIAEALAQIKEAGQHTTLIALEPLPQETLQVLKQFLPEVDNIVAYEQDLIRTLETCAKRFSVNLGQSVFVAADRVARGVATKAEVSNGASSDYRGADGSRAKLRFVRAIGDREHLERIPEVVPYFTEYTEAALGACWG